MVIISYANKSELAYACIYTTVNDVNYTICDLTTDDTSSRGYGIGHEHSYLSELFLVDDFNYTTLLDYSLWMRNNLTRPLPYTALQYDTALDSSSDCRDLKVTARNKHLALVQLGKTADACSLLQVYTIKP
jgi:hypothetical protein